MPERRELLDTAERTADWWIDHVPTDRVAYWDFDVEPGLGVERDTSATAIALAALLKLAELASDAERRTRYRAEAEATAAALLDGYLTEAGILTEGCYNRRIGLATRSELIWGSYYLYEALHVLLLVGSRQDLTPEPSWHSAGKAGAGGVWSRAARTSELCRSSLRRRDQGRIR